MIAPVTLDFIDLVEDSRRCLKKARQFLLRLDLHTIIISVFWFSSTHEFVFLKAIIMKFDEQRFGSLLHAR